MKQQPKLPKFLNQIYLRQSFDHGYITKSSWAPANLPRRKARQGTDAQRTARIWIPVFKGTLWKASPRLHSPTHHDTSRHSPDKQPGPSEVHSKTPFNLNGTRFHSFSMAFQTNHPSHTAPVSPAASWSLQGTHTRSVQGQGTLSAFYSYGASDRLTSPNS